MEKCATEFKVGVNHNDARGAIPKSVIDVLRHLAVVKFVIKGKRVEIQSGDSAENKWLIPSRRFCNNAFLSQTVVLWSNRRTFDAGNRFWS